MAHKPWSWVSHMLLSWVSKLIRMQPRELIYQCFLFYIWHFVPVLLMNQVKTPLEVFQSFSRHLPCHYVLGAHDSWVTKNDGSFGHVGWMSPERKRAAWWPLSVRWEIRWESRFQGRLLPHTTKVTLWGDGCVTLMEVIVPLCVCVSAVHVVYLKDTQFLFKKWMAQEAESFLKTFSHSQLLSLFLSLLK